jgi:hypothetical protein
VIFGKERPTDLRGVFSEAAVLWSKLPSECSRNPHLSCGHLDLVLSASLLNLFDIQENQGDLRRLNLSVYSQNDGHNRGMARVFAEVGKAKAVFIITSTGGGEDGARRLTLQRDFGDGTGDITQVKDGKKDGFVLKALNDLVGLKQEQMRSTDRELLCGSCSAKVNGLPGSIV